MVQRSSRLNRRSIAAGPGHEEVDAQQRCTPSAFFPLIGMLGEHGDAHRMQAARYASRPKSLLQLTTLASQSHHSTQSCHGVSHRAPNPSHHADRQLALRRVPKHQLGSAPLIWIFHATGHLSPHLLSQELERLRVCLIGDHVRSDVHRPSKLIDDRGHQRDLVLEVPIHRAARHASEPRHIFQRSGAHTAGSKGFQGGLEHPGAGDFGGCAIASHGAGSAVRANALWVSEVSIQPPPSVL